MPQRTPVSSPPHGTLCKAATPRGRVCLLQLSSSLSVPGLAQDGSLWDEETHPPHWSEVGAEAVDFRHTLVIFGLFIISVAVGSCLQAAWVSDFVSCSISQDMSQNVLASECGQSVD